MVMDRNTNSRIERAAEQVPEEARQEWLAMLQSLAEQIQKQQQNAQQMVQQMMETYMQLLNTPGSYLSGQAEQQQQTLQQTAQQWMEQAQRQQQAFRQQAQQQQQSFQDMTQEVLSTFTQLFSIPVSYAQEGLRTARFPIEGYDELTVGEVSDRLDGLSTEELRVVRDYEERNKKRDTLLEELDRKIRGGS
jgi:ATP-dependent Clp protease ATP-binding subunit ClpA